MTTSGGLRSGNPFHPGFTFLTTSDTWTIPSTHPAFQNSLNPDTFGRPLTPALPSPPSVFASLPHTLALFHVHFLHLSWLLCPPPVDFLSFIGLSCAQVLLLKPQAPCWRPLLVNGYLGDNLTFLRSNPSLFVLGPSEVSQATSLFYPLLQTNWIAWVLCITKKSPAIYSLGSCCFSAACDPKKQKRSQGGSGGFTGLKSQVQSNPLALEPWLLLITML